ncbi:MAG TPA: alanine-zipper protein [Aequorivita sp.]|nr:alanine-zipper protein [Aequorivita sp.]
MKSKNLNIKQNIILSLLILLLIHNLYLQTQVSQSIESIQDAESQATQAKRYANEAADYASDASDYSRKALEKATEAAKKADNAYRNSFGYHCWSCP